MKAKRQNPISVIVLLLSASLFLCANAHADDARFVVQQNGKYGYIDTSGTVVIPVKYNAARDFGDGVASVMPTASSAELIDIQGASVAKLPNYNTIGPFFEPHSEGLLVVGENVDHQGYIDTKGKLAIPTIFKAAAKFSEGLAAVSDQSGKWGWIDTSGKFVIPPQFDNAGEFKEGLARFERSRKSGFIDKSGNVVVEPIYNLVRDYSEGLSLVSMFSPGAKLPHKAFIDTKGKVVIDLPENTTSALPFQEGLAAVKIGDEAGFIDKTGTMVLKTPYDSTAPFSEGLAPVRVGDKNAGKWGCIDKNGKLTIPAEFPEKPVFKNGLAKIKAPEGVGYINKVGEWVWKPSK